MNPLMMIIGLALVWAAITGSFDMPNLLLGAAIGGLTALLLRNRFARPLALRRIRRMLSLLLLFVWELMVSAIKVARVVMRPDLKTLRPAIVAFPLTVTSDAEITLLANLITLTPGTLSLDVSEDRRVLYIHVLDLADEQQLIAEIAQGFERKVQEVFA